VIPESNNLKTDASGCQLAKVKNAPIPLASAMRFVESMACELKGERYAWVTNIGRWLGTEISSIKAAVHDPDEKHRVISE